MQNSVENDWVKENVSILGCGWLGLSLAKYLISKKYNIHGSTTRLEKFDLLERQAILPYFIDLSNAEFTNDLSVFFSNKTLIVCYPPKLKYKSLDEVLNEIERLFQCMHGQTPERMLFVSSTSIYADHNRISHEEDADPGSAFFAIEQKVRQGCESRHIQLTILRCGGLMGYGRMPCKYFDGQVGVKGANAPVNYIFRDDVIQIIAQILLKSAWGKTFNAVAPVHPSRRQVLEKCFSQTAYTPCQFDETQASTNFKIVSSEKLQSELAYTFLYPDPRLFPY